MTELTKSVPATFGTINVMLDLETLGTKPGCKILSIGASLFGSYMPPESVDSYFDAKCLSHESYQAMMDEPDPATVKWWNEQNKEAKQVLNPIYAISLDTALISFNRFINQLQQHCTKLRIWGNGATFDVPVIEEAMRRYVITPAWTFRDSMCFRTLKELGKMYGIEEPVFTGVKHNALADACHQAKWADKIFNAMQSGAWNI